jgi:hypothetical protein
MLLTSLDNVAVPNGAKAGRRPPTDASSPSRPIGGGVGGRTDGIRVEGERREDDVGGWCIV